MCFLISELYHGNWPVIYNCCEISHWITLKSYSRLACAMFSVFYSECEYIVFIHNRSNVELQCDCTPYRNCNKTNGVWLRKRWNKTLPIADAMRYLYPVLTTVHKDSGFHGVFIAVILLILIIGIQAIACYMSWGMSARNMEIPNQIKVFAWYTACRMLCRIPEIRDKTSMPIQPKTTQFDIAFKEYTISHLLMSWFLNVYPN